MARGFIITEEVDQVIAESYLEHPDWPAYQIHEDVNSRLGGKGPGLSAIQKRLAKLRKSAEEAAKNLETPWSLGASVEYNIPLEASQDLIKIWKWCTVVGMTLTIREAQWVARLRGLGPYEFLYERAVSYAKREQVCQLLGRPEVVTADLDAQIPFPIYPKYMEVEKPENAWLSFTVVGTRLLRDISAESAIFLKRDWSLGLWDKPYLAEMDLPASRKVEEYLLLEPQHPKKLSENADMIYAIWLRLFAKGRKWQSMADEAKDDIAQRLYEEVANAEKEIQDLLKAARESQDVDLVPKIVDKVVRWKPSQELFEEVGISREKEDEWALATYESERAGVKAPFWKLREWGLLAPESEEDKDERSHSQEVQE